MTIHNKQSGSTKPSEPTQRTRRPRRMSIQECWTTEFGVLVRQSLQPFDTPGDRFPVDSHFDSTIAEEVDLCGGESKPYSRVFANIQAAFRRSAQSKRDGLDGGVETCRVSHSKISTRFSNVSKKITRWLARRRVTHH